jgi:hypothetical protein
MASLPDKQDLTSARAHPVKMSQHLCLCSSPKQWSALFASIYLPRVGSSFGAAVPAPSSLVAAIAVLAVFVQAYAGASLRGLYADGAYFATKISAAQGFTIGHPARWMSKMIDQWPVVAAIPLGVQTPHGVAVVFSLVTNILPGIVVLLTLPALPAGDRRFFVFPAFVYFAGTLSAQFVSASEGLVATPYFWLLLFLITFGRFTILRLALVAVLAAGSLHLHEQMLFLGPILAISCVLRWPNERHLLPRIALSVAVLCALASAVNGGRYVLHPFSAFERDTFVTDFLAFRWLYFPPQGCNVPCVLGIMAVPCILVIMFRAAWASAMIRLFAAFSILLALAAFKLDWLTAPFAQWSARHNSALMSVPLAMLFLASRVHTPLATAITRRPVSGIVVLLGFAVSLWHVAATEKWSGFLTHFSDVLQSRTGLIAWSIVAAPSGSEQAELAWKMVWAWTNPYLSLAALPRSCVDSVIDNPPGMGPSPNVATMPAVHGVTYTYLLPPNQRRSACRAASDHQS